MQASEGENSFHEQILRAPLHRPLRITEAGLILGRGTVLARMTQGVPSHVGVDGEEERILTLLTVTFSKSLPVQLMGNLRRASDQWSRGDKCLAHIHLAFAGLPYVDEDGATRLALADEALAKGLDPHALLKALGLDSTPLAALKFDPNQPRVPAGNGPESGCWTSDGSGSDSGVLLQTGRSIAAGGGHREDKPDKNLEEERGLLGSETEQREIEHIHPVAPAVVPVFPRLRPPSRSALIGNNSKPAGSRFNTDLPGGLDEATALFESMTQGQAIEKDIGKDGATMLRAADGTQLRINVDGSIRIDRPIEIDGRKQETIHFLGK